MRTLRERKTDMIHINICLCSLQGMQKWAIAVVLFAWAVPKTTLDWMLGRASCPLRRRQASFDSWRGKHQPHSDLSNVSGEIRNLVPFADQSQQPKPHDLLRWISHYNLHLVRFCPSHVWKTAQLRLSALNLMRSHTKRVLPWLVKSPLNRLFESPRLVPKLSVTGAPQDPCTSFVPGGLKAGACLSCPFGTVPCREGMMFDAPNMRIYHDITWPSGSQRGICQQRDIMISGCSKIPGGQYMEHIISYSYPVLHATLHYIYIYTYT